MIWKACERFGIKPPGICEHWDDIDWWTQQCLLQYDAGRTIEEISSNHDFLATLCGATKI